MVRLLAVTALGLAAVSLVLVNGVSASSRAVTITWVGDIAMAASGDDGAGFFSPAIRRRLDGDVVIGNLEGTLGTGRSSKCGSSSTNCFAFQAPPSYGGLLRQAGFTLMNLANNHAYDYGAEGEAETLAALRAAHLRSTGQPGEITVVRVGGTRIAVLGFAPYPWAQSLTDIARREAARSPGGGQSRPRRRGSSTPVPKALITSTSARAPRSISARTAAIQSPSPTPSSTPERTSSSALGPMSCAGWSGTTVG